MRKKLHSMVRESLFSVLPITGIVLLLAFTISPMRVGVLGLFLMGALMLILGTGLFTLGAEMSTMPMGTHMGSNLTRRRKLYLMILVSFLMGILITMAEPDLSVLARQVPAVPDAVIIGAVALGVGLFLVLAVLRIVFQISLRLLLIGFYFTVFILAAFANPDYLAVAFDSGGVTTGPITVPFILALGIGVAGVETGRSGQDDSFGLVALCSIGPILAVTLMGLFYPANPEAVLESSMNNPETTHEMLALFGHALPHYFRDVGIALSPMVLLFLFFQWRYLRLPKSQLARMAIGILYTCVGLVIFLTGVNVGFMPAGHFLGRQIASLDYRWILIPLGMVIGYFIVSAEPAVHVLVEQVEELTGGSISKKAMMGSLAAGMAVSVGLSMVRAMTGISLWFFLIPGYLMALTLSFFVPRIFTAIAFDSGGVASGPMTATFLLPFAMGVTSAMGGNILRDAFGTVAMVAMTPLITIQVLGLVYSLRSHRNEQTREAAEDKQETEDIIEL